MKQNLNTTSFLTNIPLPLSCSPSPFIELLAFWNKKVITISDEISRKYSDIKKKVLIKKKKNRSRRIHANIVKHLYQLPSPADKFLLAFQETWFCIFSFNFILCRNPVLSPHSYSTWGPGILRPTHCHPCPKHTRHHIWTIEAPVVSSVFVSGSCVFS